MEKENLLQWKKTYSIDLFYSLFFIVMTHNSTVTIKFIRFLLLSKKNGIPSEYYRRFCPNLPHVFQNYSNEIPLIFWRKEPEFLRNFCDNLMEFLRYFLEFGWYFDGILVVF